MPPSIACLIALIFIQSDLLLEPGKAVERELAGGESHSYQLRLAADQYARVTANQRRINLALAAYDESGKKIIESDMFKTGDTEQLSLVSRAASTYRIEVRSPDKTASRGSYEIRISEPHSATERDKTEVAAESLMAEGALLDSRATTETWQQAIEKYQ